MSELTERQRQILEFMRQQAKTIIRYPTMRELAKHFGLSVATVQQHVTALKRKGALHNQ